MIAFKPMEQSPCRTAFAPLDGRQICPGTPLYSGTPRRLWSEYREASLNWLALGLLLAAWNAADNDASAAATQRPASLRCHSCVSVRAAQRSFAGESR